MCIVQVVINIVNHESLLSWPSWCPHLHRGAIYAAFVIISITNYCYHLIPSVLPNNMFHLPGFLRRMPANLVT